MNGVAACGVSVRCGCRTAPTWYDGDTKEWVCAWTMGALSLECDPGSPARQKAVVLHRRR